jgi:hypothetical protein
MTEWTSIASGGTPGITRFWWKSHINILVFSVILSWYVEAIFAVSTRSKRILLMFIRSLVSNDRIELKSIRLEKVEAFKIQHNLTRLF